MSSDSDEKVNNFFGEVVEEIDQRDISLHGINGFQRLYDNYRYWLQMDVMIWMM